jgi:ribulose-phosphate 3-epimerase
MKIKISPSVMCCDFINLKSQLDIFEENKIDLLHIDVMDGSFVPNYTLGTDFARQLKQATSIPLDIHLMVENPEKCIDWFPLGEGDYVSVHWETTKHLQKVLQAIRSKGAKALLALNPATPVEFAADVLEDIDGLLIMSVNPGFAGQKMVPHAIDKIARARAFLDANGRADAEIQVDGNVSLANAEKMLAAGGNIFVVGTSGIFWGDDMGANIRAFRGRLEKLAKGADL